MGSFIENINVDFDIQPKKKKKKDTGKTVRKPKGSKDIRSFYQKRCQKDTFMQLVFYNKKKNQRFFLKHFAGIYFRESALFNFFASINFCKLTFFEIFARTYFREFDQNSRKSRKLIHLRYLNTSVVTHIRFEVAIALLKNQSFCLFVVLIL